MQLGSSSGYSLINIYNHKKNSEESIVKIGSGKNNQLDDASLALIANAIGNDISGLTQGLKNANDAVGILQIADGVLSGLSQGAEDLNVLALKANGPAVGTREQKIIENEAKGIAESLQNSVDNASFNGQRIFGRDLEFNLGNSSISTNIPSFDMNNFDIRTQDGIAQFVKNIQAAQIEVGSTTNALVSSSNSILTAITNLSASQSQIADVDIAEEFLNFNQESTQLQASLIAQAHAGRLSVARVSMLLE